jgi:hypothetical protein
MAVAEDRLRNAVNGKESQISSSLGDGNHPTANGARRAMARAERAGEAQLSRSSSECSG